MGAAKFGWILAASSALHVVVLYASEWGVREHAVGRAVEEAPAAPVAMPLIARLKPAEPAHIAGRATPPRAPERPRAAAAANVPTAEAACAQSAGGWSEQQSIDVIPREGTAGLQTACALVALDERRQLRNVALAKTSAPALGQALIEAALRASWSEVALDLPPRWSGQLLLRVRRDAAGALRPITEIRPLAAHGGAPHAG